MPLLLFDFGIASAARQSSESESTHVIVSHDRVGVCVKWLGAFSVVSGLRATKCVDVVDRGIDVEILVGFVWEILLKLCYSMT